MWVVIQEGISAIFEQAGCGTPAVRGLLGEGGVTEGNMMQYLGILEQRTNEILQVRSPLYLGFTQGLLRVSALHQYFVSRHNIVRNKTKPSCALKTNTRKNNTFQVTRRGQKAFLLACLLAFQVPT